MLYIYTVFLFVYLLRHDGLRLLRQQILSQAPLYGNVAVSQSGHLYDGQPIVVGNLYDDSGKALVLPLVRLRMVKMTAGMHLAGIEYHGHGGLKSRLTARPQSWVCAPTEAELLELVKRIRDPVPVAGAIATIYGDDDPD